MTQQEKKTQIINWVVTGILLGLGLYNQLAEIKGWAHFEIGDAVLTKYITWAYELIIGIWAFWKNNNITNFAQLAQAVLNALQNGTLTPEQVNAFLNDPELREIADAHVSGKLVEVNITDDKN